MKPDKKTLRFLLGANTPQGFVSRFDQLADAEDGWRILVIKGGPGCGKSTMMKHLAAQMQSRSGDVELIHCSSDVDSLDGVIFPKAKLAIADGTPPHAIEPKYPGAFESLIDLTSCWDENALYAQRESIIDLSKKCTRCHEHCCRFLAAAGSLSGDTYRIALDCVNTAKLSSYCTRLADKELKPLRKGYGKERVRFFSAVTNKGVVSFGETAKLLCDRVYLIQDDHGAVSRLLLHSLRTKALTAGHDVISCYCPLSPFDKLEQLFIPELRLGFMTSNCFHDLSGELNPYRIINSRRFSNDEKLRVSKKRILFNRKAATQMLHQAESLLQEAKARHDELEAFYIAATDFAKVDALTEAVQKKIKQF